MRGLDCLSRTHLLGLVLLAGLAAGVWSSADDVSAQEGLPTRASVHTITALHQGLQVYWYEPGEDGGSALTAYDVEYSSWRRAVDRRRAHGPLAAGGDRGTALRHGLRGAGAGPKRERRGSLVDG
jgi:hypothetical protein